MHGITRLPVRLSEGFAFKLDMPVFIPTATDDDGISCSRDPGTSLILKDLLRVMMSGDTSSKHLPLRAGNNQLVHMHNVVICRFDPHAICKNPLLFRMVKPITLDHTLSSAEGRNLSAV